ncbi:MAG: spore germination protein [Clostridia bacterium]|nr:spore germination protein [Clostridia bacterium]
MKTSLVQKLKSKYTEKSQIKTIELKFGQKEIVIFYIESLVDKTLFSASILSPLQNFVNSQNKSKKDLFNVIKNQVLTVFSIEECKAVSECLQNILCGYVLIVIDEKAMSIPLYSAQKRGIQEPPTSKVIKGPREGFVEDIYTNLSLIRKRLKTPNLQLIDIVVGKQTNTNISVVYLKGIAREDILNRIVEKLNSIDIDGIIDSYYIESFLEEGRIKFFKRVGSTEKPDILCSKLLEGRIAIFVDGSPIVLTLPFVLFEDLQSSQDYYTIPAMATFARIMRVFGLIFALIAPGVYVALQSYNYRILPINFLISILSSIEGLSIPPLIEILVVLFLFEIITEASLQMPNSLAMALSIIGALALGNTAVDAGIISPPSIVVVATSSVALYIIPDEISENRLLRILFTLLGGIIGLYGIIVSFIIIVCYMTSIKSYGIPYFVPYAPDIKADKKDAFIKQDIQEMLTRPNLLVNKNKTRQKSKEKQK